MAIKCNSHLIRIFFFDKSGKKYFAHNSAGAHFLYVIYIFLLQNKMKNLVEISFSCSTKTKFIFASFCLQTSKCFITSYAFCGVAVVLLNTGQHGTTLARRVALCYLCNYLAFFEKIHDLFQKKWKFCSGGDKRGKPNKVDLTDNEFIYVFYWVLCSST